MDHDLHSRQDFMGSARVNLAAMSLEDAADRHGSSGCADGETEVLHDFMFRRWLWLDRQTRPARPRE